MSDLSFYGTIEKRVNTRLWDKGGRSLHSMVHPKHPMRLCQTVEVQSLKELKSTLYMGAPVVNTLGLFKYFPYVRGFTREKIALDHEVLDYSEEVLRLSTTLVTTEEFLKTDNALDALLGSLRLALDAIEAQFWYLLFSVGYVFPLPINTTGPNFSYREVLALGRAAVHRIAGTDNVHVLTPVIHYAAMLMDNTTGITTTQQSGVTEHHLYEAPKATIIPVAHNTDTIINNVTIPEETGQHDRIAFYPDYLPSLITRYVYEEVSIERVSQSFSDRNLRRVVLGRYLSFELPTVYSYPGLPAMPVVSIDAQQALFNVMNIKFANGFQNINTIASF